MAVESPQSPQRFRPSPLRGFRDLLLSPLFLVVTVFNVASGFLLFQRTGDLYIAIYAPLALEVLAVAVVWQYVMVSARTESVRVELMHGQEVRLRSALARVDELDERLAQLLAELSGDQSRVIEHLRANRSAMATLERDVDSRLGEQGRGLAEASNHLARIESGLTEAMEGLAGVGESQAGARQELSAQVETLREIFTAEHESMPDLLRGVSVSVQKFVDQVGRVIVQRLDELEDLVASNSSGIPAERMEQLRGEIGEELGNLSHQLSELPESARGQAGDGSLALDVATALDRLNLEVRRQMTLLRNQIEQH